MAYKTERVNEIIKEELSSQLRKMKDPRIAKTVISVTKVKATPDMKYAKVYVSVYADKTKQKEIIGILANAKGHLRSVLSDALTTKFSPELMFELDESMEYAMHIDEVLKKIDGNGKD
ncbi:MAG: 30S ribosome-binding factor RbfA [Eubacteriaceae bacterium]|jgi:ribosome-binding factor A|nr:30S ribosome-binding factor RbfA [Eubacteriaceae bacterium]